MSRENARFPESRYDEAEHPPVPQLLQEKLKDHPELIAQLQETLNRIGRSPQMSKTSLTDQFESAMWRLESRLDRFASEAAEELKVAESARDPERIAKAEAKWRLMDDCAGCVPDCLHELVVFFGQTASLFKSMDSFFVPTAKENS